MVMRFFMTILALAVISGAAFAQDSKTSAGLLAWERIFSVASHPRCANCHVGVSGRPGWDDLGYGARRLHGMNVVADASRIGAESIPCRTCHIGAEGNNDTPYAAPRVDDAWRLPPVDLAWRGKSSNEICTQLRTPETNDGFELVDLVEHVRTSVFVSYGFNPGNGRTAAPGSVDELVADLQIWGAAGMPCKAEN